MPAQPHGGRIVTVPELDVSSGGDEITLDVDSGIASAVQLIRTGVYSPLEGFTYSNDFDSILRTQRMLDGTIWPIPLILDSERGFASAGDEIFLKFNGRRIARMSVEEVFPFDRERYCDSVFDTKSGEHPGVLQTMARKEFLLSGRIIEASDPGLPLREHFKTPVETRDLFSSMGWKTVSAFQTRNVPHLGHEFLQKSSLNITDGLFINPVIGRKKTGDFSDDLIISTYSYLVSGYFPAGKALMSTVNYEMQYAGPREALLHAIMRKNFGCTHFIMGRDHAGVGNFYGPYDAQKNVMQFEDLGIQVIPFEEAVYCRKCSWITSVRTCPHDGEDILRFSASMVRNSLKAGTQPTSSVIRSDIWRMIRDHPSPVVG
ncbi:MAG: sulfate adenylyltransferase [Candidatus Thermoplasmatota archaeon]|nr:sulfate adenylyltransferase [Candidatus Thermoplasmatota archaeon]